MTPVSSAKLHKKIFLTLAFVVFAFLVYPAAADYLGPDRTYTFYIAQRSTCSYLAVKHTGSCTLSLFAPPNNCPSTSSVAPFFNNDLQACGSLWGATCNSSNCTITLTSNSVSSCSMGETGCTNVEYTGSQPPATITGGVTCTGSTVNDWCTGSAQLSLSANEPVTGYSILLIEGTLNGEPFACSSGATSCDMPLIEGQNDFTFWALSSWGDSSLMGTASGKMDTQSPSITGSLTGTGGENGWYVSDVTLTASASDPVPGSGLASFTYSLDGGAAATFPGSLTLTDGAHTVVLQATDNAGQTVTLTRSASVDTVPPVSVFTTSAPGWVRGSLTLDGITSDATSGVARVELSTDGGLTWQLLCGTTGWSYTWDTTTAADGVYTLLARAQDVAGNLESAASLTVNVDNTPPQADIDAPAAFCPECGGSTSLTYAVDDVASGLASWDLSVDGATVLASGTTATMDTLDWDGGGLPLGSHSLNLNATDMAGNTTMETTSISLESAPPPEPTAEKKTFTWFLATKTFTPEPTATRTTAPTSTPTSTRTPVVETFASVPPVAVTSPDSQSPDSESSASAILWGAGAVAVIAAATAYTLAEQRKRKAEEAAARAAAEMANKDARARDAEWSRALAEHAKIASAKGDSSGSATGGFSNTGSKKTTQIAASATSKVTGGFNNKTSAKGSTANTSHGALASTNTSTVKNTVRGTLPTTSKASTKAMNSSKKVGTTSSTFSRIARILFPVIIPTVLVVTGIYAISKVDGYNPFESIRLVYNWFTEQGETDLAYGPESSMTQDLMHDEGVIEARQAYIDAGMPVDGFAYGYKYTPVNYLREAMEFFLPTEWGGDRTGFVLGSYMVSITANEDGTLTYKVHNETGLGSGTKSPFFYLADVFGIDRSQHSLQGLLSGTQSFVMPNDLFLASILEDRERTDPCWFDTICAGGTIQETFIWTEPLP